MNTANKWLAAAISLCASLSGLVGLADTMAVTPVLQVQAPAAPRFEAASVKPSPPGSQRLGVAPGAPNRYQQIDVLLSTLIAKAYGSGIFFERYQMTGGPNEILSRRFTLDEKLPDPARPDDVPAMLQALLEERFNLRAHWETRPVPVYAVTLAHEGRLGPHLQASASTCRGAVFRDEKRPRDSQHRDICFADKYDMPPGQNAMTVRNAGDIASVISHVQMIADRLMVDGTGLTGNFEWELTSGLDPMAPSEAPQGLTALREQLGLELQPRTMPMQVLVIDSVEMPTPD